MPVPQTFTSGAFGFATKASASSMHTFKLPCPAPSPRTAAPSMYAFWLMSSFVFFTKAPAAPERRVKTNMTEFMSEGNSSCESQSTHYSNPKRLE